MSSDDNKIEKEGLTNLEFSFKYSIPIESVVSNSNKKLNKNLKQHSKRALDDDQSTILKAYHDLGLLVSDEKEIQIYEEVRKLNYLFWLKDKLKAHMRKEKKEIKKAKKKKEYKEQKKEIVKEEKGVSFLDTIVQNYFNEDDKDKLINMNGSVKHFLKDFKKVLRLKN